MNKEVSFPLAKLLKEKGFDEQTDKYYVQVFQDTFKLTRHKLWEMDEESGFQNAPHFLAPTVLDVLWWFYEKYGIWIDVSINQFSKPKDLQWMYSIVFTENCTYSHSPKSYTSPTEAYEAAIEYALKHII